MAAGDWGMGEMDLGNPLQLPKTPFNSIPLIQPPIWDMVR